MSERLFLTRDEIKLLTGTADRKKQIACLTYNRMPFTLDVFGRPVVTITAVEGRSKSSPEPDNNDCFMPSWLSKAA